MTTAQDVIDVARAEVGYIEDGGAGGHTGNITKYWAELDPPLQGQSWCAAFVSWVFKHAGFPLPAMDRPYGYMNCASAVAYAKAHGLFDASGHYAPGDIVLYGPGGTQHTGIIVSDDGTTMHTIEGNTSPDAGGSQWNGGGVYERTRPHGSWVYGVLKASRLLAPPASALPPVLQKPPTPPVVKPPTPKPPVAKPPVVKLPLPKPPVATPAPILRVGSKGAAVQRLQLGLNRAFPAYSHLVVDGNFGARTDAVIREFQRRSGFTGQNVDGVVGPNTRAALARSGITF